MASEAPTAVDAIRLIRGAGGVPILAHPCYYTSDEFIEQLVTQGLMGIEAYYPEHSRGLIERYKAWSARSGLVLTGGSDFHGPRTGRKELACVDVPESVIEDLQAAKARV